MLRKYDLIDGNRGFLYTMSVAYYFSDNNAKQTSKYNDGSGLSHCTNDTNSTKATRDAPFALDVVFITLQ